MSIRKDNALENITLGYACINVTLKDEESVCVNKGCIARTCRKKGKEHAISIAKSNLENVIKIIEWNHSHSIKLYRMSSGMFPHITNPEFIAYKDTYAYSLDQFSEYFIRIGELADRYDHRLTFHPSQYVQIGTNKENVFENTKRDLLLHSQILDKCHLDRNSVMVVHGGGVYGDKQKTLKRWIEQFNSLDRSIKDRIVIENCENSYNYLDMLYLSSQIKRPFVFDTHHHNVYSQRQVDRGYWPLKEPNTFIDDIIKTWEMCDTKPKFHVSEQHPEKRIGAHSDYVNCIPEFLIDASKQVEGGIDVMIEAKQKEKAVLKLREMY